MNENNINPTLTTRDEIETSWLGRFLLAAIILGFLLSLAFALHSLPTAEDTAPGVSVQQGTAD